MNGWIWAILSIVLVVIVIFVVRKMFKKDKDYIDLDSRLDGVKGKFSDCCRKIGKFFGV